MKPYQKAFYTFEREAFYGLFLAALVSGSFFGYIISSVSVGSELNLLAKFRPSTPTRLYDRNGIVFAELYRHRQDLIRFQDIPAHVVQAFLSVEDDNFFNHNGLDFMGILRAAIKNVLAGEIVQGGSTLTQQVAKQIYLNARGVRNRTFSQKIQEMLLALQIEEELSKEEILEVYFNVSYLGHGCRGLVCASRLYFAKKPEDLTLAEGALLARLPKAPVNYSPYKNPHGAMQQHKFTLRRMATQNYIRAEDVDAIHKKFWRTYWEYVVTRSPSQTVWSEKLDLAPYFTDYVRQLLEADIGSERLYSDGLRIYTTLDLYHQRSARAEVDDMLIMGNRNSRRHVQSLGVGGVDTGLFQIYDTLGYILPVGNVRRRGLTLRQLFRKAIQTDYLDAGEMLSLMSPARNESASFEEFRKDTRTFYSNLQVQAAFISIEPRTGYITSMIGGAKFSPQNQFNRALKAYRQPGSAFKIFVYGAAVENRIISTMTGMNDAPFFTVAPDGSTWEPLNYGEGFRGLVPAHRALAMSLNTCAVDAYYKTGPELIINLAQRLMKISNPGRFSTDPAMALGSGEVTPFEMAQAISIIANDGKDVLPFAVRHIADRSGSIFYDKESQVRRNLAIKTARNKIQVIEPGLAYILRYFMTDVRRNGTPAYTIGNTGMTGDLAVKTGTTTAWSDAWLVGFNPEYASVVWFGFDKKLTMGSTGSGSPMGGPVLGGFYRRLYKDRGLPFPSFKDRSDKNKPPRDVYKEVCGGYALRPAIIRGKKRQVLNRICPTEEHRVYDFRKLLMERMNIKPSDLKKDSRRVQFKRESTNIQ